MADKEEAFLKEDFVEHVEKFVKQCTFNPEISYLRLLTSQEISEDLSLLKADTADQGFQNFIASCSAYAQSSLRGEANENMQAACRVIGNEFLRNLYKASRDAYLKVDLAELPLGKEIIKTIERATALKQNMEIEEKDKIKITQLEQKVRQLVEPLVKAFAICQAAIVVADDRNSSNLVQYYQNLHPESKKKNEDVAKQIKLTALEHAQSLEETFQQQLRVFNVIMVELEEEIARLNSERKADAKGGRKKTKSTRKSKKTGRKFNRKSNKNSRKVNRKYSRKSRK